MTATNDTKIAWLLPSASFYWQPTLCELTKFFPSTKIFTARWKGYAKGYENSIQVEIVGQRKIVEIAPGSSGYGYNYTNVSSKIVARLFRFRPKVIFSNSFGIWTILALLFKFIGRWRVVIAYEGSSPNVDFRNSLLRLWIRRVMVRFADACITNSKAGQAYLIGILGAEPSLVFTQPYEVPDSQSLLTSSSDLEDLNYPDPTFIFVGNIIPRKGLSTLLQACKLLKKQGFKNYRVLIIGDGYQKSELESLTSDYGLESSVQWLGRVDYDCLGEYFNSADVFVLPTLEDTWGMVVLEAMVFGKAILCSQAAGTAELIQEGESGYCFDPQKPEQLAELMSYFIEQPERAVSLGIKAKQTMDRYTPQAAASFLSSVVSSVL